MTVYEAFNTAFAHDKASRLVTLTVLGLTIAAVLVVRRQDEPDWRNVGVVAMLGYYAALGFKYEQRGRGEVIGLPALATDELADDEPGAGEEA